MIVEHGHHDDRGRSDLPEFSADLETILTSSQPIVETTDKGRTTGAWRYLQRRGIDPGRLPKCIKVRPNALAGNIGALVAETIVLVNPERNYAQFLLRALLPVIIHVVIAIAAEVPLC